jgi:hypothetical protein
VSFTVRIAEDGPEASIAWYVLGVERSRAAPRNRPRADRLRRRRSHHELLESIRNSV